MDSITSSRSNSFAYPSLATPSLLQVRGLADELREFRQQGETFPVRKVLDRHPELATQKSVVIELANEDLCQRSEKGEKIDIREYCKQLPIFEEEIRRMVEAHGWVEEKGPLLNEHLPAVFPDVGQEFMGFNLLHELGRGSFACVYLAAEPALGNRLVALKISLKANAEPEILGRLNHRNIVPIHSAQKDPKTGFTVVCMPYLGSATLCDLLKQIHKLRGLPTRARAIVDACQDRVASDYVEMRHQVPDPIMEKGTFVDGILNLGVQLAEALEFIHSLGICHCDLKPSNVLMSPDARPRLLDFNLAFREQAAGKRLGGTIPYMSPEFLRAMDPARTGYPAQVDARSDVFSLGVMLVELLTGQHPFGPFEIKDDYEEMRKGILEQQGKGFRVNWSTNPRVDSKITVLLDRCLSFRPEDRPQTSDLARELRRSVSVARRVRRWISLNVRLLVVICAVAGGAITLGAYWAIPKGPLTLRQFNKGIELYGQGRLDEASEHFIRSVRSDPNNADAQFALGRTFQHMKLFAPAAEAYLAAYRLRPNRRTEACLGYCSAQLANHGGAIAQENAAIEGGFRTAEILNNRGYSWLQSKEGLENAEGDFIEAIGLNGSLQAPHYNLALLELVRAYKEKDHKLACQRGIRHIQDALSIGPARADLFYTAAKLCSFAAEKDKSYVASALNYLNESIRLGLSGSRLEKDFNGFKGISDNPQFRQLASSPSLQAEPDETPRLLDPVSD
jgi:serine/threonine protein kinase